MTTQFKNGERSIPERPYHVIMSCFSQRGGIFPCLLLHHHYAQNGVYEKSA